MEIWDCFLWKKTDGTERVTELPVSICPFPHGCTMFCGLPGVQPLRFRLVPPQKTCIIPWVDKYMQSGGKSFAAAAACFQKEMCPFFSFHEKPGKRSFGFYSFFAPGTLQFCFFVDIRCIQTNSCCFPGLFAPW